MNNFKRFLTICIFVFCAVFLFCACSDGIADSGLVGGNSSSPAVTANSSGSFETSVVKGEDERTVIFVQEGLPDVVKIVKKGSTLTDVPSPVVLDERYEYVWSVADFSLIEDDITVYEVKTRVYTVNLDLGARAGDEYVSSVPETIRLKAGEYLELPELSCEGYIFGGWTDSKGEKITSGIFNYNDDFTIVAQWGIDYTSDRWVDENGRI